MINIDKYLAECVYYPCSGVHGFPIKFLGSRFQRFLYADYHVTRELFDYAIEEGCKGYQLTAMDELTPEAVFGMSWGKMLGRNSGTIKQIHFEWDNPFVVLCRFERTSDFDEEHGPEVFELMFAKCEAVAAFIEAFSRRNITPKCLVHIRSGVGFGGNFSEYPQVLANAVGENKAGLPSYMLYDRIGSDSKYGDYFPLVEEYQDIIEIRGYPDGGRLTIARVNPEYRTDR